MTIYNSGDKIVLFHFSFTVCSNLSKMIFFSHQNANTCNFSVKNMASKFWKPTVMMILLPVYSHLKHSLIHTNFEFKQLWYETYSGKITTKLLNDIKLTLNQDCVDEIAKRLDVVGLADLLSVCKNSSLDQIAGRRFSNLIINQTSVGSSFGLMNLCYVLHLMGDIVESIIISLHSFRGGTRNKWNQKLKYSILYNVCYFTGPNLKSITLEHFELDVNDLNFRSLMNNLQARNVVITTN